MRLVTALGKAALLRARARGARTTAFVAGFFLIGSLVNCALALTKRLCVVLGKRFRGRFDYAPPWPRTAQLSWHIMRPLSRAECAEYAPNALNFYLAHSAQWGAPKSIPRCRGVWGFILAHVFCPFSASVRVTPDTLQRHRRGCSARLP